MVDSLGAQTGCRIGRPEPAVLLGVVVALLSVGLGLGACAAGGSAEDGRPLVVATTTIVGDLASQVAGDQARVDVLIPVGADPHDFAPSARQAASLREADLVVISGLRLEAGLADALEAAADDGVPILELGPALDPRPLGGSESETLDPHWWLDPLRAADATELIGERLGTVAAGDWAARATAFAAELDALHQELRARLTAVSAERRKLVTTHDAFGYFAARYGFEVIGVVIPGGATQAAPDPQGLAALAAAIRQAGVPAIFAETTLSTNIADALAAEVGSDVRVVVLYTGSLGEPGSGADTYLGMLRMNAERIVDGLV